MKRTNQVVSYNQYKNAFQMIVLYNSAYAINGEWEKQDHVTKLLSKACKVEGQKCKVIKAHYRLSICDLQGLAGMFQYHCDILAFHQHTVGIYWQVYLEQIGGK